MEHGRQATPALRSRTSLADKPTSGRPPAPPWCRRRNRRRPCRLPPPGGGHRSYLLSHLQLREFPHAGERRQHGWTRGRFANRLASCMHPERPRSRRGVPFTRQSARPPGVDVCLMAGTDWITPARVAWVAGIRGFRQSLRTVLAPRELRASHSRKAGIDQGEGRYSREESKSGPNQVGRKRR